MHECNSHMPFLPCGKQNSSLRQSPASVLFIRFPVLMLEGSCFPCGFHDTQISVLKQYGTNQTGKTNLNFRRGLGRSYSNGSINNGCRVYCQFKGLRTHPDNQIGQAREACGTVDPLMGSHFLRGPSKGHQSEFLP